MRSFALLLLVVTVAGCTVHSNAVPAPGLLEPSQNSAQWLVFVRRLRDSLSSADPVQAAQAALTRRDYHLLGINEYALVVPGLSTDWSKYKPGIYVLPAGGDAHQSPDQEAYMHVASQYAAAYNRTILGSAQLPH